MNALSQFIRRLHPFWHYSFAWIFICGIGIYLRLFPLLHHTSDDAREKASLLVMKNIRAQVARSVAQGYPNLKPVEKSALIKAELDRLIRDEKDNVRKTINQLSHQLTRQEPEKEKFYLLESDSYYHYDLTKNIIETGKISPEIKGSKFFYSKMTAPYGYWEPFTLHPYVGFIVHSILNFFHPGTPLFFSLSFTSLELMTLTVIPFLVICAFLFCSPLSAFIAGIYLVAAPIYLKRSMFGWYDNDPYNVLFPLLILSIIFIGLARLYRQGFPYRSALLAAACLTLYALFWQGWVFFVGVIAVAAFLSFILRLVIPGNSAISPKPKTSVWAMNGFFALIVIGSFLGISLIFGPKEFFTLIQEGWTALTEFGHPTFNVWPDLYLTVGELHRAKPGDLLESTGGPIMVALALLGGLSFFTKFRLDKDRWPAGVLIFVFFAFAFASTLGAQRFALLIMAPYSILAALGIDQLFRFIDLTSTQSRLSFRIKKFLTFATKFLLIAVLISVPVYNGLTKAESLLNPIFNETWEKALTEIKEQTPKDSIVNTWWSPGHFIKAISDRRVTFDGATIKQKQSYWLANTFLSMDEITGLGYLRLLNDSANKSVDYLEGIGFELPEAIRILKQIVPLNRSQAEGYLAPKLDHKQIQELLALTHGTAPPSYLLISNDLVEDNIMLDFVGKWDFDKAQKISRSPALLKRLPPARSKAYVSFLWEMAGGYPRYSGVLTPVAQSSLGIVFSQNVLVDLKNLTCRVDSPQYGKGIPRKIYYLENNEIKEKILPGANLSYSVLIAPDGKSYQCVLLDDDLARSLLIRLYFFNGAGLKFIKPFIEESDLTGRTLLKVFEVDWAGFQKFTNNQQ